MAGIAGTPQAGETVAEGQGEDPRRPDRPRRPQRRGPVIRALAPGFSLAPGQDGLWTPSKDGAAVADLAQGEALAREVIARSYLTPEELELADRVARDDPARFARRLATPPADLLTAD
ncbi:MAG: hypothetical protein R3F62_31625 [Planctomycetota bacterium]